ERMLDGDYRWVNRGGVDLMGIAPDAGTSAFGLPRSESLYGSLPEQLADPSSFASGLKRMLAARERYDIDLSEFVAVPDAGTPSVCLLIFRPPGPPRVVVTALNFGREAVEETLDFSSVTEIPLSEVVGRPAIDAITDARMADVSPKGQLSIKLDALS